MAVALISSEVNTENTREYKHRCIQTYEPVFCQKKKQLTLLCKYIWQ